MAGTARAAVSSTTRQKSGLLRGQGQPTTLEWSRQGQPTGGPGPVASASAPGSDGDDQPPSTGGRGARYAGSTRFGSGLVPVWVRAGIARVDRTVDAWFEPVRGRPALDAMAKVVAGLSDHGVIWTAEAAWRARRPGPERRRAVRDLALAGLTSSFVNRALKSTVGRARPDRTSLVLRAGRVPVREPTTSSFPSGHTLAAFCVATVSADRRHPWATIARFGAAGMVGASRIHLRAHHASDVLGGVAVGLAAGGFWRALR